MSKDTLLANPPKCNYEIKDLSKPSIIISPQPVRPLKRQPSVKHAHAEDLQGCLAHMDADTYLTIDRVRANEGYSLSNEDSLHLPALPKTPDLHVKLFRNQYNIIECRT